LTRPRAASFIGDVGDGSREEVDVMEAGESALNFQWSVIEGLNGDLTPPYIGIQSPAYFGLFALGGARRDRRHVYRGSEFATGTGRALYFRDNVVGLIWVMNESTTPATKIAIGTLPKGNGPNSDLITPVSPHSDWMRITNFTCAKMSSLGGRILQAGQAGAPAASRPLPTLLSQTGAFADLATLDPNLGVGSLRGQLAFVVRRCV